ncbi:MAG: hypothetical protein QW524_00310 [Candidatus Woesearchaeota archaeon]
MENKYYQKFVRGILFLIFANVLMYFAHGLSIVDLSTFDLLNRSFGNVTLRANLSEGTHEYFSCSLYLNDNLNETKIAQNNTIVSFVKLNLNSSSYSYRIECSNDTETASLSGNFFVNRVFSARSNAEVIVYKNYPFRLNLTSIFNVNDPERDVIGFELLTENDEVSLSENILEGNFSKEGIFVLNFSLYEVNVEPKFQRIGTLTIKSMIPQGSLEYNKSITLNDDEAKKQGEKVYGRFTLINTGTIPLEIKLTSSTDSLKVENKKTYSFSISPNEEARINLEYLIDFNLPSGVNEIATLTIEANNSQFNFKMSDSIKVFVFVPSLLEVNELYLSAELSNEEINLLSSDFERKENKYTIKSSSNYLPVKPGDQVRIEVLLKANLLNFYDIYGKLKIDKDEFDIETENEESYIEIKKDKTDKISFSFDVPQRVKSDTTYPFEITIEGKDSTYRRRHRITILGYLTIDKDSKSIYVKDITLNPTEIDCKYSTTYLTGTIYNTGYSQITLNYRLINRDLNFTIENSCTLREYTSSRRSDDYCDIFEEISFNKNINPGNYRFEFGVTDNSGRLLYGPQYIALKVKECPVIQPTLPEKPAEEKKNESIVVIEVPTNQTETPTVIIEEPSKTQLKEVILYTAIIILLISVIVMTIILIRNLK